MLAEKLASVGEDTNGKSQEELAQAAYVRFEDEMNVLHIEHLDAKASFGAFGEGRAAWAYQAGSDGDVAR